MDNNNIYQREVASTLYEDSCHIIEEARTYAFRAINTALTLRNWKLGERISHEHLEDDGRAEYGKYVIKSLSDKLTDKYGKGFDSVSLYNYIKFYRLFPMIVDAPCSTLKTVEWILTKPYYGLNNFY